MRNAVLFDHKITNADEMYLALRDKEHLQPQREFVEVLWRKYQLHAEKDFKPEITHHFHQRFWEMYLAVTLLELGFELLPKKKKDPTGPDLCFTDVHQRQVWLEATAPERGTGVEAVPISRLDTAYYIDEEKILLRLTSAIQAKYEAYKRYIDKRIVTRDDPCIIAINGWLIPDSSTAGHIPYLVQVALPFGRLSAIYDRETLKLIDHGYQYRPQVAKTTGAPVVTDIFLNSDYSQISGLLFSRASAIYPSSQLGEDFIFLHNPNVRNALEIGWLHRGFEYWLEDNELRNTVWKN